MNCVQTVKMLGSFSQNKRMLLALASSMATTMQNLLGDSIITVLVQNPRQYAGDGGEGIVACGNGQFVDGQTGKEVKL